MSERYSEEEIDRLLNAAYCPSLPLKGVIRQLRDDLALNLRALHELQAGAARDREEIVKLREALRWALDELAETIEYWRKQQVRDDVIGPYDEARKLLGEGEK